ncbi:MAG: hypothetical protein QXK93_02115 [Candidatus Bathyarchaeia archaeon]
MKNLIITDCINLNLPRLPRYRRFRCSETPKVPRRFSESEGCLGILKTNRFICGFESVLNVVPFPKAAGISFL